MNIKQLFISIIVSIVLVSLIAFVKRNTNDCFYLKFSTSGVFLALFFFFFSGGILNDTGKFHIGFLVLSGIFVLLAIFPLFTYCQVIGNDLILKENLFKKKETVNISKIKEIKIGLDANPDSRLHLIINTIKNKTYRIDSQIENLNGFLEKISQLNNNIILTGSQTSIFFSTLTELGITLLLFVVGIYRVVSTN